MATTIQSGRSSSPKLTADVASRAEVYGGRGLVFDGATDYLKSDIGSTTYSTYTISCWVNPTSLSNWIRIVQVDNTSSRYLGLHGDGRVISSYYSGSWSEGYTTTTLSTGNWYHLALVDDDTQTKIYINGVATTLANSIQVSGSNIYIGSHNGTGNFFDGKISDVKFFSSALSESDIRSQYLKPESVPSPSTLVAWYPMSEGNPDSPQSIVYDHSEKKLGSELWDNDYSSGIGSWDNVSSNDVTNDSGAIKITYVDHQAGAVIYFRDSDDLSSNLTVGSLYKLTFKAKVNTGSVTFRVSATSAYDSIITETDFTSKTIYFKATSTNNNWIEQQGMGSGEIIWLKDFALKEVLMGNHATTNFFEEQITNGDMTSEPTINGQNITHSNSHHIRQAGPLGGQSWIMTVTNGSGGGDSQIKVKPLDSSLIGATMNISIKLYKPSAFTSLQVRYIKEDTNPVNIGSAITADDTWTTITGTVPANVTGGSNFQPINVVASGGSTGSQYYIDEISVKVVGISSTGFATAQNEPVIPQIPLVKYNEKMLFSDANYVNCGALLGNDYSGGLTISLWFNATAMQTNNGLFSFNSGLECGAIFENDKVAWYLNGAKWSQSSTITLGKTYHVVFSLDTSSHANSGIYINGVKDSTGTATNFPASDVLDFATLPFIIGRYYSDAFSHDGLIDAVSMFNTAFDSTQIQELFNDGVALDATTHSKADDYLLGYWRNDGVSTWTDRGDIQAIGFDGSDDYVSVDGIISDIATQTGTINLWVMPTSDTGTTDMVFTYNSSSIRTDMMFRYNWATNSLEAGLAQSGSQKWYAYTATNSVSSHINSWNMITLVHDGSAPICYINGVDAEWTVSGSDATFWLGDMSGVNKSSLGIWNFTSLSNAFIGKIGQSAVWNKNLSASEISAIYALGRKTDLTTSYSTNLKGYWLLNPTHSNPDLTGSNKILDRSGNGNHGTQNGGVNFLGANDGDVQGTPDAITIREGLNSNKDGLGFPLTNPTSNIVRFSRNGLAEHLSIPTTKGFDIQEGFTVECWFKQPDMGTGYQHMINRDDSVNSHRNWLILSKNGAIEVGLFSGGSYSNTVTSGTYDDDNWHHLCAVVTTGTSVQIYIDTVLAKLNTTSIPTTIDNDPSVFQIGNRSGTDQFFIGSIDEVRFYNKALTAFEADGSAPEEGETATSGEVVKNYKHGKGKHKND